jgi:hypothetical protein
MYAIQQTLFVKKSVESCAQMLMKSTPGVNFTNILLAAFLYESFSQSFLVLAF